MEEEEREGNKWSLAPAPTLSWLGSSLSANLGVSEGLVARG